MDKPNKSVLSILDNTKKTGKELKEGEFISSFETFQCHDRDCRHKVVIMRSEDPTTSKGGCKCCGGRNWTIT